MKYSILILLSLLIISCNTQTKKHAENISVVKQYIKAVEKKDYNIIEDLLSDDYQGFGPSFHHSIGKQDAVANWKQNSERLYQEIKYMRSEFAGLTIKEGENKGDWVNNWAELNIQYKNRKGEGKIWANSNYKIENGKIVKSYTFYNEADVLRQLGYVFIHPNDL